MKWDLFISHASEDKDTIVREIASLLRDSGFKVWYDEFSLTLGDSLSRSIDRGLAQSQFGLVVLSKSFFEKEWPRRELDGLVARESAGGKVILPIWHEVDHKDVIRYSPTLADKVSVKTSQGVSYVVEKITEIIKPIPNKVIELTAISLRSIQHQIFAPLSTILHNTEWMQMYLNKDNQNLSRNYKAFEKLEEIKQTIFFIKMLMETVGFYDENMRLTKQPVKLNGIIRDCINLLSTEIRNHKIEIIIDQNEVGTALADQRALTLVFYNLIANAIRYSDYSKQDRFIKIKIVNDIDSILVEITDNGIKIMPGEEEKIFLPFTRGSNASFASPVGSGLGLYICREIVKQHNGSITASSGNSIGQTVFIVKFPKTHSNVV